MQQRNRHLERVGDAVLPHHSPPRQESNSVAPTACGVRGASKLDRDRAGSNEKAIGTLDSVALPIRVNGYSRWPVVGNLPGPPRSVWHQLRNNIITRAISG